MARKKNQTYRVVRFRSPRAMPVTLTCSAPDAGAAARKVSAGREPKPTGQRVSGGEVYIDFDSTIVVTMLPDAPETPATSSVISIVTG